MKKTISILASLILVVLMSINVNAQVLLNEQFDYPIGDSLTAHGWINHSGVSTNNISTVGGNLSYAGYCTPSGQSAYMTTGQDVNHTFTAQTTGSVYAAILINVATPSTAGDHFFHFMTGTTTFTGRVYIKKDASDATKFTLGVLKGSSATNIVYTTTSYSTNTTHLIVLKYTINSGAGDDVVSLFVNPSTASEGTPTVTASDVASTDLSPFAAIALRQAGANTNTLTVDGLRVATTWADAIGFSGTITAPTVTTGTATGITATTATCGGEVTSDGSGTITSRGICYGATANPDTTTKVIVSGTTGAFTGDITGLTAGNTYHYRAYAINSAGLSYGADANFTTATGAVAPVVTTGTASPVGSTTATVAGNVTNDGGDAVIERGICYGATANPDTTIRLLVSGTTGAFSGNLTGLTGSTLYHARAFARNSVGLSYGADITFTTLVAGVPCANIAELLTKTADNSTIYELNGEVTLTFKQAYKNQKWIQDGTAAIMIYDGTTPAVITTAYNIGDGITGIRGKLQNYHGLLELIPVNDPGAATSTGNVIAPTVVTLSDLLTADTLTTYTHQSKLIKLVGVLFTNANGTLKFATSKKYKMTQGTTTDTAFFCNFYDANYCATATARVIPSGLGDVTGIAILSFGNYYITARDNNDISLINGINKFEDNNINVYPNPAKNNIFVSLDGVYDISIMSLLGQRVYSQDNASGSVRIDCSNFGKGIFFVQARNNDNKTITKRVVVE